MENANEDAIINLSYLNTQIGGKKEQIKEMLNLFIIHTPPSLSEIKILLANQRWDELKKKVHSIKSYYGYVGNSVLQQKLLDWERALVEKREHYSHHEVLSEIEEKTILIIERLKQILAEDF